MDVTFTNVLEGARQYFQGLPMGSGSTASPMYPSTPEIQQRSNNEPTRNHEMHAASGAYWMGQPESHRLPPREPAPTQRPPSYNNEISRPSSHSLYANTSQEQRRTPSYPANYPEQSSVFQQQHNQQQQPQHQPQHQQQQDFQFTRPHFRETPSNVSHQYSSHIQQNSAYHHSPSTHNSVSPQNPSPSPKQHRKVEQNVTPPHSSHHSQIPMQPSTSYSSFQQGRTYYPSTSYANLQGSSENKDYPPSHSYPYQQSSQVNYYKNVYQPHSSSSSSVQYNLNTVSQSSNPEYQTVSYNQASRTHNLPPIAQLSDSYSKSVRENQKLNIARSQANMDSGMPVVKNSVPNTQNMAPSVSQSSSHQDYKMEYQYQNRATSQQEYLSSTPTITTTSLSYNTVTTCRSSSSFSVPTLTSSTTQNFTPSKSTSQSVYSGSYNAVNVSHQSSSSIPSNSPSVDRKRPLSGGKQKRESPLDLSVKTVRTPADSTLDDTENERSQFFATNRVPPIVTSNHPSYDSYGSSYQRTNNTQRVTQMTSASAPKVDFLPNFNVSTMRNANQSFRPDQRPVTAPFQNNPARNTRLPHENSNNTILQRDKEHPMNRYPTVSVPSISNVNSYMQSQANNKNASKVLPRIDFPTVGHSLKTSALYPSHNLDSLKKRPADTAPTLTSKVARVESWRQTIDQQIEQKLSSYKQIQQPPKQSLPNKTPMQNGNYNPNVMDRSKDIYNNYGRSQYQGVPPQQPYNIGQYHSHTSHSQTYVPSPVSNQYTTNYSNHQQNAYPQNELNRSNTNSSLPFVKTGLGGAADKRVLTLLRNSIEIKGVKEAQRKYEQEQFQKYAEQPHHRSDVQHPSTHVTAPLQPKPAFMGRQNVSPFTPNSLPEGNNVTPMYNKLHVPRAVDSINFETKSGNLGNKQLVETVINDQNNPNGDLDGLAAFLAARIRTKAELKQVSPTQQANNNSNNHNTVENSIRTSFKQDHFISGFTSGALASASPPKLTKECQQSQQPRKRLFSRTEDDNGNLAAKGLPSRDKSGMRSSSETSVFDFPDSGSDGEMPVLEMQSLTAMRRDRKSSLKQSSSNTDIRENKIRETSPRPLTPEDDIFLKACDTFMDQLKAGVGKKRGRRKKTLEPDVLAKLETVTKERPIIDEMKIKVEVEEDLEDKSKEFVVSSTECSKSENPDLPCETVDPINQPDLTSEQPIQPEIKKELIDHTDEQDESIQEESSKTQTDQSDSDSETIKQLSNKLKNRAIKNSPEEPEPIMKPNEFITVGTKPPKKPTFGDGSAFYPGWEEEVYKYKKSLRMPPSLIQVTRPPSAMRLSTSLPDLDPCPCSPSSSIVPEKEEDSKNIFTKIKSEPIDSDIESNSGFNLFNSRSNYDSEGSASIKSLPVPTKDSIVDKLLEKCGKKKRKKYKRREEQGPKIIPKSENPVELLPTPGLDLKNIESAKEAIVKTESPILGFRKSTIENFKNAFLNRASNIVGMGDQFSTVVLKSRTRKESRVMKQRATIKEVFGEDRPASAPPVTCINADIKTDIKKEIEEPAEIEEIKVDVKNLDLKEIINGREKTKNNLLKSITDKNLKSEVLEKGIVSLKDIKSVSRDQSPSTFSEDLDSKSETPSLDGDENSNNSMRRRVKFNKMRRKFSSGFDYIRKKKKQVKKETDQNEIVPKKNKRFATNKATPESEQDIQKEIKSWVLNKGIGETHLHRSARLGYTDITAYCLEKMECNPSPKDNAGYTPLHEACSRGHVDIARLLLMYGANVSESAKGGIRPLHEAVENGYLEIIRLLLSYGADPKLATYSGLTPLSLATDEATRELLQNHLNDLEGKSLVPWSFNGPASCFDPRDSGYDVLSSPPEPDPPSEDEDIEFEVSENLLPNLYVLQGEPQSDRWVLLQDLSNIMKIKSRDALLKQLCPSPTPGTSSSTYKSFLRELKMSEFLEQAHCCQFLNASEKINPRASKIALVKYTDKIRELLKVEKVVITAR